MSAVGVEMVGVVKPPTRAQMVLAGLALFLCFMVVGGSAAWVSFTHIRDVALIGHQPPSMALVYPFSVDGMLGIASIAMWQDKVAGRHPRAWATFVFWFGLVASMMANMTSHVVVWGWDIVGITVAAWPPVALLFSVEVVSKPGRVKQVAQQIARAEAAVGRAVETARSLAPTARTTAGSDESGPQSTGDDSRSTDPPGEGADNNDASAVVDAELLRIALEEGRAYRARMNGRMISRDELRERIRARLNRGISNLVAKRLLAEIRVDADCQAEGDEVTSGEPVSAGV